MEEAIDLEEYLAEQKGFLRRFELHVLRMQNMEGLPLTRSPSEWDAVMMEFIYADAGHKLS